MSSAGAGLLSAGCVGCGLGAGRCMTRPELPPVATPSSDAGLFASPDAAGLAPVLWPPACTAAAEEGWALDAGASAWRAAG